MHSFEQQQANQIFPELTHYPLPIGYYLVTRSLRPPGADFELDFDFVFHIPCDTGCGALDKSEGLDFLDAHRRKKSVF